MTTKKAEPLGEAPASMNWYGVTKGGWNVQFTLRDTDEYVLLTRFGDFVKKLEEYYVTPKGKQNGNGKPVTQPTVSPNTPAPEFPNADPGYCTIHDTPMKEWEKEGRTWFSHKIEGTESWCKGK